VRQLHAARVQDQETVQQLTYRLLPLQQLVLHPNHVLLSFGLPILKAFFRVYWVDNSVDRR
jgi:hypothetical protein